MQICSWQEAIQNIVGLRARVVADLGGFEQLLHAPQLRQWALPENHDCTCFEMSSACTIASSDRPSARVRPNPARQQSGRSIAARTSSPSSTASLSPSASLASIINRMAYSHHCEADQPSPEETKAANGSTCGCPSEFPQLFHALHFVNVDQRLLLGQILCSRYRAPRQHAGRFNFRRNRSRPLNSSDRFRAMSSKSGLRRLDPEETVAIG